MRKVLFSSRIAAWVFLCACGLHVLGASSISIVSAGQTYSQDFDALPSSGTFTLSSPLVHLGTGGATDLGIGALDGWYIANILDGTTSAAFRVDDGTSTAGGAFSYGTAGAPDRALGSLASTSTAPSNTPRLGALVTNNTGRTLHSVTITFDAEQWRAGNASVAQTLAFSYCVGTTSINSGTFKAVTALNCDSKISGTTGIALDGNLAANRRASVKAIISSIQWDPGVTLAIRWDDANDANADSGLAIDNFSIKVSTSAQKQSGGLVYLLNPNGGNHTIYGYAANESTGVLSTLSGFPFTIPNSRSVRNGSKSMYIDQVRRRLYCLTFLTPSGTYCSAYSINDSTGALTELPFSPLTLPVVSAALYNTVNVHPSGSPLVISAGQSGVIASYNVTATTATPATGSPYIVNKLYNSTFSLQNYAYFGNDSTGDNYFDGYSVDPQTGVFVRLTGAPFALGGPISARGCATDSSARLFLTSDDGKTRVFTTSNGIPTPVTGSPFTNGVTASQAALHPSENFYLMPGSSAAKVAVLSVSGSGAATTLTPVTGSPFSSGGTGTEQLAVSTTGKMVFAANSTTRNVTSFSMDTSTGALTQLVTQASNTLGTSGTINGMGYLPPGAGFSDLTVSIVGAPQFASGGQFSYSVKVSNAGPNIATNIDIGVDFKMPPNAMLLTADAGVGTYDADAGIWTLGSLAVGASVELKLTMSVGDFAVGSDTITTTASVLQADNSLLNPADDSATAIVQLQLSSLVDLTVTASAVPAQVVAGSGLHNVVHKITVTNQGPSVATGLFVSSVHTIPSGVAVDSVVATKGSYASQTNLWSVGSLSANASATLTWTDTVAASAAEAGDAIKTIAFVSAVDQPLDKTGDDQATATTSILRRADLKVSCSSPPSTVAGAGSGNLIFELSVQNLGPSDSQGIQMLLLPEFPEHVELEDLIPSVGTVDAQNGTWSIDSLPKGSIVKLQAIFTVGASAQAAPAAVQFSGEVLTSLTSLINTSDDVAAASGGIVHNSDLKVTCAAPASVVAGSGDGNLQFLVTVQNLGPSDSDNVTLNAAQLLPAGTGFVSAVSPGATLVDGQNLFWDAGSLQSGESKTLTLSYTVPASAAAAANAASVNAVIGAAGSTLINLGDDSNSASASITRNVDLQLSGVATSDPVGAGSGAGNVHHLITVKNAGPSEATSIGVPVSVLLPAGVTIDNYIPQAGTTFDSNILVWNVPKLLPGEACVLDVSMTAGVSAASAAQAILTQATATAVEPLLNLQDDVLKLSSSIVRNVDVALALDATPGTVIAGSGEANLKFILTLTNRGPIDATQLTISTQSVLPDGVSLVLSSVDKGSFADTGKWNIDSLPVGTAAKLQLFYTVAASAHVGMDVITVSAKVDSALETLVKTEDDKVSKKASITFDVISNPSAAPNPAGTGQAVNFTILTAGDGLSFLWDFGDGTQAEGASVSHVYAAPLTYNATVTINDGLGGQKPATLPVTVVAPLVGSGNDSDGDGFSDEIEIAMKSDPLSSASTPSGAPLTAPGELVVSKGAVSLNFTVNGKDTIQLSGTCTLPEGFSPANSTVALDFGGVSRMFKLSAKGSSSKSGDDTFKLSTSSKNPLDADFSAAFKKGSFAAAMSKLGLTPDAAQGPVTIPVTLILGDRVLQKSEVLMYVPKKGKTATAKSVK